MLRLPSAWLFLGLALVAAGCSSTVTPLAGLPTVSPSEGLLTIDSSVVGLDRGSMSMDALRSFSERIAARNPAHAAANAAYFASRFDQDLICQQLWLVVAPKARVLLEAGDLEITFASGRTVRDAGFVVFAPPGRPPQTQTADGPGVVLDGRDDPDEKGRMMYLFVPAPTDADEIVRVGLARKGLSP